jgi:hypothetical protein
LRVDLQAVISGVVGADTGVPVGASLRRFARATILGSAHELDAARAELLGEIGPEAVADAAAVAAFFNAYDRVADATGTISDGPMRESIAHLLPGFDVAATIGVEAR